MMGLREKVSCTTPFLIDFCQLLSFLVEDSNRTIACSVTADTPTCLQLFSLM